MNRLLLSLVGGFLLSPSASYAESYAPTAHIGAFLRAFEKAYRAGDGEWFRSAVDKEGIVAEATAAYFSLLGPTRSPDEITHLSVAAAPENYQPPNSLLDFAVESTIPVDFIITFHRNETTIRVPAGYRDGKIWLAGLKRK